MKYFPILYLFVIFLSPSQVRTQINDLPSFKNFILLSSDRHFRLYSDDKSRSQFNQSHVIDSKKDGKKYFREYSRRGYLIVHAEIQEIVSGDTTEVWDRELHSSVLSAFNHTRNVPHGLYLEYYPYKQERLKSKGMCDQGRRIGTWEFYDQYNNKTVVTFNTQGEYYGPYEEYFYMEESKSYQLKCKGEFGEITRSIENVIDPISYQQTTKVYYEIGRVGTWELYDRNGRLIGQTEYKWFVE